MTVESGATVSAAAAAAPFVAATLATRAAVAHERREACEVGKDSVSFSPNGQLVVTAGQDGTARFSSPTHGLPGS